MSEPLHRMGQLSQTTSMYVHRMRPADSRSPTHSLRAFLRFLARSDDGARRAERPQVRKIRLHISYNGRVITGTPFHSLRRRPISMYVAVLNASAQRDFGVCRWRSMARSALVSTPIVHSATPFDTAWCGTGGTAWSIALAQMSRMLRIDNSR